MQESALWNEFEFVTLLFQVAQSGWKGVVELLYALEGVVEGDDGTVPGVQYHIAQDVVGIEIT